MNVPKLRFPEFVGEWEEVEFGEIVGFRSGGTPSKSVDSYWDGDIPWISAASMHDDRITTSERSVTELGAENGTRKAEKNTVLLLVRGSMLYNRIPAGICDRLVTFNQDVKALAPMGDEAPTYILAFIRAKEDKLLSMVTGTGIGAGKLDTDELKALRFDRPSLPEQKKITAFLGVVDAKIAALRVRRDGLERYKRGLMQALFSQTLRFTKEDGNAFPDWEEKRLGKLCDALSGYPVAGDEIVEFPNDTPLLRGINITEGRVRHSEEMDKFHGGDVEGLERFLVEENDVVVAMDGSKVGKNVATISKDDAGSFLIQRVTRLRTDGENDLRLIYQHITSHRFRNYVDVVNTSSGIPHISLKQIRDFPIPTPHPDEQAKIADALSAMDAKIAAMTGQLERMQDFKKGLLQQMFV